MEIRRFFLDTPITSSTAIVEGNEFHHMTDVLRHKVGYKTILCDNSGYDFYATIERIEKNYAVCRIDEKVKKHSESIDAKVQKEETSTKKTWLKAILIFLFVAVPLPLTGVWTGACVAVAIGLDFWQVCVSCILGNVVAGLIIMFVCSVFPQFTTIIFIIFLAIILCLILYAIIKLIINKKKNNEKTSE